MKTTFALLFLALSASAQTISVGVKGGIPFNSEPSTLQGGKFFDNYWTVGPTVELSLPKRFAIGVDALYRRYESNTSEISHWQFPMYLKYHLTNNETVRPFVELGGVVGYARTSSDVSSSFTTRFSEVGGGLVTGGGVEFRAKRFKIAPEARYTRWYNGIYERQGKDQAELLIGIRF